jgi:hypothetical protein
MTRQSVRIVQRSVKAHSGIRSESTERANEASSISLWPDAAKGEDYDDDDKRNHATPLAKLTTSPFWSGNVDSHAPEAFGVLMQCGSQLSREPV